jgi:hypothetical protein
MTGPEEALGRARQAAQRKRADGTYPPDGPGALESSIAPDTPSSELLGEWAVISVDPANVYSTRRLGAPITAVKRMLMRLLRQYHVELEAKQTRFNITLLEHVRELERRVARLERSRDD